MHPKCEIIFGAKCGLFSIALPFNYGLAKVVPLNICFYILHSLFGAKYAIEKKPFYFKKWMI